MAARPYAAGLITLAAVVATTPARAQDPQHDAATGDSYSLDARSETYVQLYERALLPGPAGALVTTERLAPIHEYVTLRADNLDAPWRKDSLDVELSAWGTATIGDLNAYGGPDQQAVGRRVDGDLQSANVRYRHDQVWLRLGRQYFAGGAARFARFDGLAAGGTLPFGLGAEAYGGLSVLPRFDLRPGYYQLGSASDTLLRDPEALESPNRTENWLAGGRLYYRAGWLDAGVSLHEQHEDGGLAHRNLGADLRVVPWERASLAANAILDLDSSQLADGRAWADVTLIDPLDLGVEVSHAVPSLLLSRQSVLSVFSTDAYDELGGRATWRAFERLTLNASGFAELYPDEVGTRAEVAARISADRWGRTILRIGYTRVDAPENGYHSMRDSLRQEITEHLTGVAEFYLYLYDEDIHGHSNSQVYAANLEWWALDNLSLLWGASMTSSPYAKSDLQTLVRVVYGLEEVSP